MDNGWKLSFVHNIYDTRILFISRLGRDEEEGAQQRMTTKHRVSKPGTAFKQSEKTTRQPLLTNGHGATGTTWLVDSNK